jgi:TP901 family phage tail tape measure protein|uniref:Minor tail protein n=1 Tax=Siphoviridae sp. ctBtS10 TaxID=2826190 RepID=A0A8S5QSI2_9CAUD|nr:MAG TPA: minor tail protein [Siphoviridae sp. ctBtS10]
MAKIIFKGVPDFTEVRAEIAKLKQEVASVSSTKVNLNGTAQGLNGAANAAGKLAQNLQKVSTTFDANGQASRQVFDFSERLGETTRVVMTLNKKTGELIPTQQTVTENYRQQAQAAEKAAAAGLKATRQANAYLQQQSRAAQNTPYNPTAMQRQIEGMVGIGNAAKSAAGSAGAFERAWSNIQAKYGQSQGLFSGNAESAKEYIKTLDGLQNAQVKATGIVQSSAGTFQTFQASVKNADGTAQNFKIAIDQATGEVHRLNEGVAESTEKNGLLGDSFTNVYLKMLQWQVMGTIVSKTIGAFRYAISTMKAVDDEMVTVRKVTGFTAEQMENLRDRAYETASAYGEAADEYLNSVAAFARAGYGEQADALAELDTKTKLVGDTNAETAQQFLLSVDAAYQYKGNIDALTKVLDGANEIDNKYATSIEKLAEGLGTVAPVAAQAHVGIDELTAAIGTITAVTQRSGSEAARAFRALVLNIVGDTKTEIDEGVTWTTGEIAGLRDVIREYAPAAYEAAKATGEVIDPMEAIGGLAQSMKDGLLTEQKLMEMVSDIGGKLRTSQLLALIQNWDMYQSMLKDYANAVGSADEEVENALDSWTRKTNILKNEWTEFIQSMVSTDAVKGGLDVLIGAVESLNTDLGHAAVTAGAVSLGLIGIQAAAKGATAAFTKLSAAGIAMNPWILAIGAAVAAFEFLWNATEDYRKSLDELNTDISDNTEKLEENRRRLTEINELGWNEKTPEILNEKAALEQENAELERQIEKLKKLEERQAKRTLKSAGGYVGTGETVYHLTSMGESRGGAEALGLTGRTFKSYAELTAYLDQYIPGAAEKSRKELEALGVQFEETEKKAYQTGETYEKSLIAQASALSEKLKENRGDLGDLQKEYDSVTTGLARFAQAHDVLGDKNTEAKAALDKLNKAYDEASNRITYYVNDLIREQKQAGKTGDQIYNLVKRMIVLNEKKLDLSQQIGALRQLATEAGAAAYSVGMIGAAKTQDVERTIKGLLQTGKAKTYDEARAIVLNRIYKSMFTDTGRDSGTVDTTSKVDTSSTTSSTGKSTKDAELERLKDIVSLRKSELSLMQERGDSTADQIDKMRQIQAALHAQAEYMRRIGASQADINALSTEHWKITKQIKELQEDLWDELEDAVNKKLEEAADARDKQVDAIDKQIEALKDAKQAEDEALKLEQLKAAVLEKQNALLEAQKERTVRVFNAATGQWEWEANASSVKSAQDAYEKAKEDLAEYERELALQREIDELEAKKTLIEETYNTLKAEWKRITDSLQNPTRTISDILSDIARNGTPKMREQVDEVNNLLGKLNQYIAGAINGGQFPGQPGGVTNGTGTTGGFHFDFNKNPGGGWTDAEMNEGFNGSSASGWQLADGSAADLNFKDTTPYGKGEQGKYKGPDMSRDEKLAGKTVEKNGYVITYDKLGYAVSATNVHKGAARDDLSGIYTKVDANGNEMHYVGYDKNVDYNLAIKQAKESGAGEGVIKQLETERQNKINAMYGGVDPDKGGKPSSGSSSPSGGSSRPSGGGSSGGGFHFDFNKNPGGGWTDAEMNEGFKPPSGGGSSSSKSNSSGSSGKGYDSNVDYSLAIKNAEKNGASQSTIDKLKSERQNKINDKYGGKDPYKKYDSGGILRGLGGIKATSQDEIVIPPLLAEKMLEPSADSIFQKRMSELGWLYGAAERGGTMPGKTVMSRTSYDHYGDSYSVNGVQIGAEAANRLTVAQVMQALNHGAGNLGLYKH